MAQQLSLVQIDDPVRDAAKHLIRNYVKRGDDISYLKDMGASSPDSYSAGISGYLNGKRYGSDKILVFRDMNGKVVNQLYSKQEIYDELKNE